MKQRELYSPSSSPPILAWIANYIWGIADRDGLIALNAPIDLEVPDKAVFGP